MTMRLKNCLARLNDGQMFFDVVLFAGNLVVDNVGKQKQVYERLGEVSLEKKIS
jgi:hypothetical protein